MRTEVHPLNISITLIITIKDSMSLSQTRKKRNNNRPNKKIKYLKLFHHLSNLTSRNTWILTIRNNWEFCCTFLLVLPVNNLHPNKNIWFRAWRSTTYSWQKKIQDGESAWKRAVTVAKHSSCLFKDIQRMDNSLKLKQTIQPGNPDAKQNRRIKITFHKVYV